MKFLVFKFLVIFFYLISINLSYSIDELIIKNIVINKNPKTYKNVTFKDINDNSVNIENFRNISFFKFTYHLSHSERV